MKLFSKEVNLKLFKQYPKGGDLQNQVVVTKIFNPYGAGRWYLINSDPDDPDYIWAIVQMGSIVEVGSVSRNQLESIRIKPFNLPLERDLYFDPVNAAELFKGLSEGKFYKAGGWTEGSENKAMLLNQAEGFEHHAEELEKAVKASDHIPAWVVAKSERASTDLSDITHYLDGENEQKREMVEGEEEEEEYADGGEVKWQEAEYGDNALVVSENKMGVIIKPYGRKFHLKFVDGTEKTYDANELKFFKDMDDFDMGGEVKGFDVMFFREVKVRDGSKMEVMRDREYYKGSLKEVMSKVLAGFQPTDVYANIKERGVEGFAARVKADGTAKIISDKYGLEKGDIEVERLSEEEEVEERASRKKLFGLFKEGGKIKVGKTVMFQGKKAKVISKKGDMYFVEIENYHPNGDSMHTVIRESEVDKMAMGGKVKFKDKVAAVKKSLLKSKKVPKAVQKDYGKTFSPAEAEDSAKRIVGAMTAKERLQARLKNRKK